MPIAEHAADGVVAFRERVGFDSHEVAERTLDCESASVDLGLHVLDDGPYAPVDGGARPAWPPRRLAAIAGQDCRSTGLNTTHASGGSMIDSDWKCPWAGTGADSTPPMLPCPLPP